MGRKIRRHAWLATVLLLPEGAGCEPSKSEQCQALAQAINAVAVAAPAGDEPSSLSQLAEQAENSAARVSHLKLRDARLRALRDRYQVSARAYAEANRRFGQNVGALSVAQGNPDASVRRSAEQQAVATRESVRSLARSISLIGDELTGYCSGR
jgi:uncharacterized protein with von Willebrand factor type A (vWA) domain